MAGTRQVQLRRVGELYDIVLGLNDGTTYKLLENGWTNAGAVLEIRIKADVDDLAHADRVVAPIQRLLSTAQANAQSLYSNPVYVYTKVCDDIYQECELAEIGATWLRKRVTSGAVMVQDWGVATAPYVLITLTLTVDELWQRATATPFLTGVGASSGETGLITVSSGGSLMAPRVRWDVDSGLTARYFWYHGISVAHPATDTTFIQIGATLKAWWDNTNHWFEIIDHAGNSAHSSAQAFAVAELVEVVFVWAPGARMAIYINGVKNGELASCTFTVADTYTVVAPTGGEAALLASVQVWPGYLSDAICADLHDWGQPEIECPFFVTPADGKNTNAAWRLRHVPGDAWAPVRLVISSATNFDMARVALKPGRTPYSVKLECESGTLGANTTSQADADASGGNVARFTPADTSWGTRVTAPVVALASGVYQVTGEWRLLLAGLDGAASANINQMRWRLVVAGVANDWSDTLSFGAVGTRSLLDLGTFTLPPGAWPEGADRAGSGVFATDFVTVELQAKNTTGSGGGTLDMDCLYLFPAEMEGTAEFADFVGATQFVMLDFITDPPSGVTVYDWREMEFAGWADWVGDQLGLLPAFGSYDGGLLTLFCYRDTAEQAYPNDTLSLTLFVAPRYRR